MTFDAGSPGGLLNLAAAGLLGGKAAATIVLMRRDRARRYAGRSGMVLWWITKITPPIAVPCLIAAAQLQHRPADAWGFAALMAFVAVAVPVAVWRRRRHGWA